MGGPDRDVGGSYDVAIVGGGVQGACLFDRLAGGGHRVLLCDGGDFAGGTTQASALLVWGGLLYLARGDVRAGVGLSRCRDRWLAGSPDLAEPHAMSFVLGRRPHRRPLAARAALWAYWAVGGGRRRPPRFDTAFAEQAFLAPASAAARVRYEEGRLRPSDAQLVAHWLRPSATARAINHCRAVGGGYDRRCQRWCLDLHDAATGRAVEVTARWVVNAAGPRADRVNDTFDVRSPWEHVLAKGASLCVPRPAGHRDTLVFDAADAADGYSLVPWGPVSMWGSTEDVVGSPEEGRHADRGDVERLLELLNRHLRRPIEPADVVSLRCGVRPLVVRRGTRPADPSRASKQWRVHVDADRPWVTLYGGKITSSPEMAGRAAAVLGRRLGPAAGPVRRVESPLPATASFPGLSAPVPSAAWCRRWQACRSLDDYLRRRTNVAQWVPRGGLGRHGEHRPALVEIAAEFGDDPAAAVDAYERTIERDHDAVLGTSSEPVVSHA